MNEISYIGGIEGTLAPYGGVCALTWTCHREGFLRDINVGMSPAELITIFEFNVVRGADVLHRLVGSVEHKRPDTDDGLVLPSIWSSGTNLACFIGIINEHGLGIWMEQGDVVQVRVANQSSGPLPFHMGLLFFTASLSAVPRLWWARIEDGILVQPLKPNEEGLAVGTRRGDYVLVNPYTYVGFDRRETES